MERVTKKRNDGYHWNNAFLTKKKMQKYVKSSTTKNISTQTPKRGYLEFLLIFLFILSSSKLFRALDLSKAEQLGMFSLFFWNTPLFAF